MKDERILKKVAKLLKMYGVAEDELQKFMADVQDAKYDDQEEIEEAETDEEVAEQPVEEEATEPVEEESVETETTEGNEGGEEEMETGEQEVANDSEEVPVAEEEAPVVPQETEQVEGNDIEAVKAESEIEELKKTNEALASRLKALEDVVMQLGLVKEQESPVGESPMANPVEAGENDAFARINKRRLG